MWQAFPRVKCIILSDMAAHYYGRALGGGYLLMTVGLSTNNWRWMTVNCHCHDDHIVIYSVCSTLSLHSAIVNTTKIVQSVVFVRSSTLRKHCWFVPLLYGMFVLHIHVHLGTYILVIVWNCILPSLMNHMVDLRHSKLRNGEKPISRHIPILRSKPINRFSFIAPHPSHSITRFRKMPDWKFILYSLYITFKSFYCSFQSVKILNQNGKGSLGKSHGSSFSLFHISCTSNGPWKKIYSVSFNCMTFFMSLSAFWYYYWVYVEYVRDLITCMHTVWTPIPLSRLPSRATQRYCTFKRCLSTTYKPVSLNQQWYLETHY